MNPSCFSLINNFFVAAFVRTRRSCFHIAVLSRATATTLIRANKKPRLMARRGDKVFVRFSFSPNHRIRAGIGTCIEIETSTGCRGVIGPVPQPLCMRPLVSTDADRLIYGLAIVKTLFFWDPHDSQFPCRLDASAPRSPPPLLGRAQES